MGGNHRDWHPIPIEVQPFWYDLQGFPDILEIPFQFWQDVPWRNLHGWDNLDGFLKTLKGYADEAWAKGLDWGFVSHDWTVIKCDPEASVLRRFLEYGKEKGLEFVSYLGYYRRRARLDGRPSV